MKFSMTGKGWPFNTCDCLIELTAWVGLTVVWILSSIPGTFQPNLFSIGSMERYHLCISTNIILITLLKTVFTIFWTDTNQTLKISQSIQIISCRFSMPFWCVYIFNRDCNLIYDWSRFKSISNQIAIYINY